MYQKYIKRFLDIVLSLVMSIVLCLPMAMITLITRLDTRESVVFSQIRSGQFRKPFVLYKFRTMPCEVRDDIPTAQAAGKIQMDKWQRFLRSTSLDELPQLVNILRGEMSFVGPRPVICKESDLIQEREKYHANDVKPGLTGWAQIHGRDSIDYKEKARLDGEYVKRISFLFDMKCIIKTVSTVFTNKGI